jgi:transposase
MEPNESRFMLERKSRLQLQRLIADGNTPQKIVKRARIVLMTADGHGVMAIMREVGVAKTTVWRWQEYFAEAGVEGLVEGRSKPPGRTPISAAIKLKVVEKTVKERPVNATHWSVRSMAKEMGISHTSYRNMFFTPGTSGMADYWSAVSNHGVNFQGSVVVGWYQEPFTMIQEQGKDRWNRFQDCVNTAHTAPNNPYTVPSGNLVAVITSPGIDLFGYIGYGSFLPDAVDMGGMTHEVGHGLGYQHSFSDDPNFRDASWAQIGEYDDEWDAMSWANAYGSATANYGSAAPGVNGPHADDMGWIPHDEILTVGADGVASSIIQLEALSSSGHNIKLIRIPFDPADLFHYYTVEYRTLTGYDTGIPSSIVLIHEVKKGDRGAITESW